MASGALWCVLLDIRFNVCPAFGGCGCEHFPREPLVVLVDESLHKEGLRKRRAGSHSDGSQGWRSHTVIPSPSSHDSACSCLPCVSEAEFAGAKAPMVCGLLKVC